MQKDRIADQHDQNSCLFTHGTALVVGQKNTLGQLVAFNLVAMRLSTLTVRAFGI